MTSLLHAYDRLWCDLDFMGISALWDRDEGLPIYIGDEYPTPLIGWQELTRHWGKLGGRLHSVVMNSRQVAANRVGTDLAVLVFLSVWQLVAVESPERHTGQRWVTAILRKGDAGWRFIYQAEAPAFLDEEQIEELGAGEFT